MDDHQFLQIIDSTPLVSIDLIIRNDQNQVLLGRRTNRPAQGWWFVPGGRIRKNEKVRDAFTRIARSELGITANIDQAELLGAFDHIYNDNYLGKPGINTHYVVLGYKLSIRVDTHLKTDDQHSEVRWWHIKDMLDDPLVHDNTKSYFSV